ncbi:hypothetical protein OIDMADRAFT_59459 [Oidiodendron maius Zn]|uniref:Uncharacterized protein n=1 Tax=Oidiodendron maius (strain Zn) TaxID=913774 RepID=A0A0C3GZM1_OIDMZ|nr:hypothetical protein OIDMADRAFT_59459 [Oidiodendron maius Zn]
MPLKDLTPGSSLEPTPTNNDTPPTQRCTALLYPTGTGTDTDTDTDTESADTGPRYIDEPHVGLAGSSAPGSRALPIAGMGKPKRKHARWRKWCSPSQNGAALLSFRFSLGPRLVPTHLVTLLPPSSSLQAR